MDKPARRYKDSTESAQHSEMEAELPSVESVCQKLDADLAASSALKVYLRLRPRVGGKPFTNPAFELRTETTVVSTTATLEHQQQKCFSFNKVFSEGSSQEQLFQEVVQEPLDAFIQGTNVLLFAYGPTAGGKTYTMQGPCTDPGVVPRTLDRLFRLLSNQICTGAPVRPDCFADVVQLSAEEQAAIFRLKTQLLGEKGARSAADFSTFHLPCNGSDASLFLSGLSEGSDGSPGRVLLWISFYEIYNEGIYDLLLPSVEATAKKGGRGARRTLMKLSEDQAKRSFIRGLTEVPVYTADEAHRLLCLAYHNRSVAETRLNRSSSRSHCIFTVRLVASGAGSRDWHVSSLMLCDLAGSEKPSQSGAEGLRLREAGRINTSLMVLSRCLEGLRRNKDSVKKVPVPFRESKLTKVMQAFFTTGGRVSLVVNICPSLGMFEESLNALKFSAIACQVVTLQLEPRQERCHRAVRRLTEVWNTARASVGEGRPASGLGSSMNADSSAGPAALDPAETDELFDMISTLQQELADTDKMLKWKEKLLRDSRAEATEYKNFAAKLQEAQKEFQDIANKELAARVRNACEITRLDLYRRAEVGSNMELLGRCEEAERRVAELKKELDELREHGAEGHSLCVAPLMDDKMTQTDEDSTLEKELEALLAAAGVEIEGLRSSLEEMTSQLACEVQARRDAEDSAQQANDELAVVSQKLDEEVARSSELGQDLEELRHRTQEHELSLCKCLDDKDKALKEAEMSWCILRDDMEREVAARKSAEARCSTLARELEDTTESASKDKQLLQELQLRLEEAEAKLCDSCEELAARELSLKAALELVKDREEQLSRLRLPDPVPDENRPHRTRRTTRVTAAMAEASDCDSDFKTPARKPRTRRVKESVAALEDSLEDVGDRRSVLTDDNAESSPLKRLSDMAAVMSIRNANDDTPASTLKARRHQLLPADPGFVEVEDFAPSARKTPGRRQAKQ